VLFFRAAASQNRAQQFRVQNLRASAAKDAADGCKRGDDEVLNSPYILRWLADIQRRMWLSGCQMDEVEYMFAGMP
jgi:hypothetical protein